MGVRLMPLLVTEADVPTELLLDQPEQFWNVAQPKLTVFNVHPSGQLGSISFRTTMKLASGV